ncbi:MAG: hypothetical protein ACE5J4_01180 [Candidatus Aenigmatarchaeota archaeon]
MGYVIGVSSGMFMAAEAAEKLQYVTVPQKAFYGALKGVTFTQVDIESITEFKEPDLKKEVEKIKKLGLRIGIHGESYAMGGAEKPISMLDSAIEIEYIHAHQRLLQHIDGCAKIGAEYVNIHPSETTPFIRLGMHLTPSKLVDPWGRPFEDFLGKNPKLIEWALTQPFICEIVFRYHRGDLFEEYVRRELQELRRIRGKELSEEEIKQVKKETKENMIRALKRYVASPELSYGAERVAYYIVAKWMQNKRDSLWMSIVGKILKDENLPKLAMQGAGKSWVPAVSAKYIYGHFNPKDKRFKDPKKILEKNKLFFIFETQMGGGGLEGLYRLMRPRDMIFLCKAIGSKWVGVCFDFEHVLSQNIDPVEEIKSIPFGSASWIKVCHLGWPTPHAPAHVPIFLGSKQQIWLYERLLELRKRGFKDGYLIFERAGRIAAGGPVQESVLAIRLIKKYLEKDIPTKELPEDFFGLPKGGPEIKRQQVTIREHFMDPLKGMLEIPEEEFTFLSSAAVKKGKAEEWKKEKRR